MYTSTLDVKTCAKIIKKLVYINASGIYNVGAKDAISKKDFALIFAKLLKKEINYIEKSVSSSKVKRGKFLGLDVSKVENIQSVGITGNGKPLSWETDYPMTEIVKDSLYKAIITTETGYLFAEGKCTVNGNFELQDQPNRRINFDTKNDTTYIDMVFDKE